MDKKPDWKIIISAILTVLGFMGITLFKPWSVFGWTIAEVANTPTTGPVATAIEKTANTQTPNAAATFDSGAVERINMPYVISSTKDAAEDTLKKMGLNDIDFIRAFDNDIPKNHIIAQNISSGEEVIASTSIVLTISKGPQAPNGWTDDSSFSNNEFYNVETKVQYSACTRSVTSEQTTSDKPELSGWTLVNAETEYTDYGPWSDWTDQSTENSTTVQVETKIVELGTKEEIFLGRYYSISKDKFSPNLLDSSYQFDGGWFDKSGVVFLGQVYSGGRSDCYQIGNNAYYYFPIGEFGGQTRTTSLGSKTMYRFRQREEEKTYYYIREVQGEWSAYSEWSDNEITENNNTRVKTRTVYKYTEK